MTKLRANPTNKRTLELPHWSFYWVFDLVQQDDLPAVTSWGFGSCICSLEVQVGLSSSEPILTSQTVCTNRL